MLISFLTPIIPLLYNDEIWRALIYPGGGKIFRPCSRLSRSLGCSGKHRPPALQWLLAASRHLHQRDWRARRSLPCKCILARRTQDEGDLLCSVWRSCDFMTHGANEIQPSPQSPCCGHRMAATQWQKCLGVFNQEEKNVRTSKLEKCLDS